MRGPDKITIEAASRNGHAVLSITCLTPKPEPKRLSYVPTNVCGRRVEMPVTEALKLFGPNRRLSDLNVVCTACGGKVYDARTQASVGIARRNS
jgi:hypothetical protein